VAFDYIAAISLNLQLFGFAIAPRTSHLKKSNPRSPRRISHNVRDDHSCEARNLHVPRHYFPEHTRFVADAKNRTTTFRSYDANSPFSSRSHGGFHRRANNGDGIGGGY